MRPVSVTLYLLVCSSQHDWILRGCTGGRAPRSGELGEHDAHASIDHLQFRWFLILVVLLFWNIKQRPLSFVQKLGSAGGYAADLEFDASFTLLLRRKEAVNFPSDEVVEVPQGQSEHVEIVLIFDLLWRFGEI